MYQFPADVLDFLDCLRRRVVPPIVLHSFPVTQAQSVCRLFTSGNPPYHLVEEWFEASFFNACPEDCADVQAFIEEGLAALYNTLVFEFSPMPLFQKG